MADIDLRQLYDTYLPAIVRRARAMLGSDADAWDASQETFRRLLERGAPFRSEADPMTYVYRVTTNVCLNVLRSRTRFKAALSAAPTVSCEPRSVEARDLLHALVEHLDDRALQIASLHFIDGLTQEQICPVVNLSRKTVGLELQKVRRVATELVALPALASGGARG